MDEIRNVTSFVPPGGLDRSPLIKWTGSKCVEDISEDSQQWFNRDQRYFNPALLGTSQRFFTDQNGVQRQCGWLTFLDPALLNGSLNQYVAWFSTSQSNVSAGRADVIVAAAQAQRWLVAIHPFSIGNGRTSRLVMDLALESYGIPAPILYEQNSDLSHTEQSWAKEISDGIQHTMDMLEHCVSAPSDIRCRRI